MKIPVELQPEIWVFMVVLGGGQGRRRVDGGEEVRKGFREGGKRER